MTKTIVILGAGYAGMGCAHKLLKSTVPRIPDLKVVLVTPNTHFYWNPAAVRAIIPGEIPDDTLFAPIEPGFSKYPEKNFEFILGAATSVDPGTNSVIVSTKSGNRKVVYDHLVIATGAGMAAADMPFKLLGTTEETKSSLHTLQKKVEAAKSIVIAGGGSTGVETAGELGEKYGTTKKITLVMASKRPLDTLQPKVSQVAENELRKLHVDIVSGVKVVSQREDGVELSDGRKLPADLYLPLFGVRPNTSFLPPQMLTPVGDVKQDSHLRVEGYSNVWAAGDVGNLEWKQILTAEPQSAHVAHNLHLVLTGCTAKTYSPRKPIIGVTFGKKTGTGEIAGWKLFGFLVVMAKGKTLMTEKLPGLIAGH